MRLCLTVLLTLFTAIFSDPNCTPYELAAISNLADGGAPDFKVSDFIGSDSIDDVYKDIKETVKNKDIEERVGKDKSIAFYKSLDKTIYTKNKLTFKFKSTQHYDSFLKYSAANLDNLPENIKPVVAESLSHIKQERYKGMAHKLGMVAENNPDFKQFEGEYFPKGSTIEEKVKSLETLLEKEKKGELDGKTSLFLKSDYDKKERPIVNKDGTPRTAHYNLIESLNKDRPCDT